MEMTNQVAVQSAVARLLRPLVRLLLRYGIPVGAFMDIAKQVYVDVAMTDFAIPDRKPTISRASVITGLTRKEIQRLLRIPDLAADATREGYNRAVRVIGGWVRDRQFTDEKGEPAPLPLEGGEASFAALVRRYSGDVPPRAILDELVRVGAATRLDDGRVRLEGRAYVPNAGEEEKLGILGSDVADLIHTINFNLQQPADQSRLQLKVAYDNLPGEGLAGFRAMGAREAMRLLEALDKKLAGMDRDTTPVAEGTGRFRAGLGIYYFEEDLSEQEEAKAV